ncbi:MAG: hypothetical protein ACPKQO_02380 [Nitrososphaeraceae archaeon]
MISNNVLDTFSMNGSLFSLIFIDINKELFTNSKDFNIEDEMNVIDFLSPNIMDVLRSKESQFLLSEIIPNSNLDNIKNNDINNIIIFNGTWFLDVRNGQIFLFDMLLTKITKDGISRDVHKINNMIIDESPPIKLVPGDVTLLKGKADLINTHTNTVTNIGILLILQKDIMYVLLESKSLDQFYNGQPIYGSVDQT